MCKKKCVFFTRVYFTRGKLTTGYGISTFAQKLNKLSSYIIAGICPECLEGGANCIIQIFAIMCVKVYT